MLAPAHPRSDSGHADANGLPLSTNLSCALHVFGPAAPAQAMLEEREQHTPQPVDVQAADDPAVVRDRDDAGLFRDD